VRGRAQVCVQDLYLTPLYPLVSPELPTLALVGEGVSDDSLGALLRLGYRGYLRPEQPPTILIDALGTILGGELWAERKVLMYALQHGRHSRVSAREQEVLHYLMRGWENADIARQLGITVKTVKTHVSSILAKLGVRRRVELLTQVQYDHPGQRQPAAQTGVAPPSPHK
jgi:DNA-binding NarL/FixJ family response regulator